MFEKWYYLCPPPFPNQGWDRGGTKGREETSDIIQEPLPCHLGIRKYDMNVKISCFSLLPAGSCLSLCCHSPSPRRGCTTGLALISRDRGTARTRGGCELPRCPPSARAGCAHGAGLGVTAALPLPLLLAPRAMALHSRQQKSDQQLFLLLPSTQSATSTS